MATLNKLNKVKAVHARSGNCWCRLSNEVATDA